jgi:tetratricopeptide (TPR) repeat protein
VRQPAAAVGGGGGWKWYVLLAAVMAVTLVSYANSVTNDFVFDDIHLIAEHPLKGGVGKIPQLLGMGGRWGSAYRPVRMISYAIDYSLNEWIWGKVWGGGRKEAGLTPAGYHIGNWVYHLVTVLLVFLVTRRLAGSMGVGLLAAGLFALHPVHTDSVTYLSGRRDILFTLFYLLGFYYFLRYRETGKWQWLAGTCAAYGLSLGSKEMGVTLPLICLSYDVVKGYRRDDAVRGEGRGYARELLEAFKGALAGSWLFYGAIFVGACWYGYYKVFVKSPSFQKTYYGDSALTTFLTMGKVVVHYLRLLVYPIRLNADYSYDAFPLSSSLFEPGTLGAFAVLGVLVYAAWRLMRWRAMAGFGVIWFVVTLLPVSHIIPHHELLAEHYLYVPSVGLVLTAGMLLEGMAGRGRNGRWVWAWVAAVLVLFSLRIADRNRDWRDGLSLWGKTVITAPRCARAHANLCGAYADAGLPDKAIGACEQALAIKPDQIEAHNNLGAAFARKGFFDKAVVEYQKALTLRPYYAKAHLNLGYAYFKSGKSDEALYEYGQAQQINPRYPEIYNGRGVVLVERGDYEQGIAEYRRALEIAPDYAEAHYNLGLARLKTGQVDSAIEAFLNACTANPGYADAYLNLGTAYSSRSDTEKAIAAFTRALELKPDYAEALYNLGVVYERKGELEQAAAAYERARALSPDRFSLLNNLGNVYFRQGRIDEAIAAYKRALQLKEDFAGTHNNLAMAYFKAGEYALAMKHADRAQELGFSVNPQLVQDLLPYR